MIAFSAKKSTPAPLVDEGEHCPLACGWQQSSEAGRKGDKLRARRGDGPEQVTMDNESKGAVEASSY
jgi:hypothetical protein